MSTPTKKRRCPTRRARSYSVTVLLRYTIVYIESSATPHFLIHCGRTIHRYIVCESASLVNNYALCSINTPTTTIFICHNRMLRRRWPQRERPYTLILSICLSVCLFCQSPKCVYKNTLFSKSKQFRAMVSIGCCFCTSVVKRCRG